MPVVLDPLLPYGMTLTVSDRDGTVYSATIPGSRWQLQPPIGSRWTYADKGGMLAGVRKARIKRIGKAGVATGYEVDLLAKDVDLSAADFPGVNVTHQSRTARQRGAVRRPAQPDVPRAGHHADLPLNSTAGKSFGTEQGDETLRAPVDVDIAVK